MCSWCYGFSPVISAIEVAYRDRLPIGLIMGGLRPGNTEPTTAAFREEILGHWREVHKRTGQPFNFDGALPNGFVYDTEPPSRAIVALAELDSAAMFAYFRSVQHAFYAEGQDVTHSETLAALAQQHGIDCGKFLELFNSDDVKQKTQLHFHQTQRSGITGFPTVVLQDDNGAGLLTAGYRPFEELKPKIEEWLTATP